MNRPEWLPAGALRRPAWTRSRLLVPVPPLLVAVAAVGVWYACLSRGDGEAAQVALYRGYALAAFGGAFEFVWLCGGILRSGRKCSEDASVLGALITAFIGLFLALVWFGNQPSAFGPAFPALLWAIVRYARVRGVLVRPVPLAPVRPVRPRLSA